MMITTPRQQKILDTALKIAVKNGFNKVNRTTVAKAMNLTAPAVQYHFKTTTNLRQHVMRYAVELECLDVIAQGLAIHDTEAHKASFKLRRKALSTLLAS